MKFDTSLISQNLSDMPAFAKAADEMGFDGIWMSETNSDPFLQLTLAAEHTKSAELGTAIAVAFPRSPTTLAQIGYDLARLSGGRFIMGLGTQVRAHNERRFGVKWEKPVRKLRETIEAMHAVWETWETGKQLNYEGEFFQLNLMTPFFSPPPLKMPRPQIYISAVNKLMLKLVGKRCDGAHLHAFHTKKYFEEFAVPHIESGLAQEGRDRSELALTSGVFVVPTNSAAEAAEYEAFCRQQISFYMSTPAYRIVTEIHGWEDTAFKLSKLARKGEWEEMPKLITDEILDEIALSGTWAELPQKVHNRYGSILDRVSYYMPFEPGKSDEGWHASVRGFAALKNTE